MKLRKNELELIFNTLLNDDFLSFLNIDERSKLILKMRLCDNNGFKKIAKHFNLSTHRVSCIYNLSLRQLKGRMSFFLTQHNKLSDTIKQNEWLMEENKALTNKLNSNYLKNIHYLELSERTYNCLESQNIHTVGDIVNFGRNKLKSIRNFGEKSLREVDDLLKSFKIEY